MLFLLVSLFLVLSMPCLVSLDFGLTLTSTLNAVLLMSAIMHSPVYHTECCMFQPMCGVLLFKKSQTKMITYHFGRMFVTKRKFMRNIKHWHTALCVVGELGCTITEQLLVNIVHDVCINVC